MKGIIFDTERWSLSDGPGTRTVVFLKGCPLHCPWCANPESQYSQPQIGIFTRKCIGCDRCTSSCPVDLAKPALHGGFGTNAACTLCGQCVEVCPTRSRRWMGESATPEEVLKEIKKDMIFYRKSFGGVTFSGGEPLAQPMFLNEILKGCKKVGIHTAIETCGVFNFSAAEECVQRLDFVMFDLKHMNAERHRELTGASNAIVLENAEKIAAMNIPMVIRIPVIPSLNNSKENIRATAQFVRDKLHSVLGIEVLPYHRLGLTKYAALGLDYTLPDIPTPDQKHIKMIQDIINDHGVDCITANTNFDRQSRRRSLKLVG